MLILHGVLTEGKPIAEVVALLCVFSKDPARQVFTLGTSADSRTMLGSLNSAIAHDAQGKQIQLAGWELSNKLWPAVMCTALKHRILPPVALRHYPERKFNSSDSFFGIERIYTQGAYIQPPQLHEFLNHCLPEEEPVTLAEQQLVYEHKPGCELPADWESVVRKQLMKMITITDAYING